MQCGRRINLFYANCTIYKNCNRNILLSVHRLNSFDNNMKLVLCFGVLLTFSFIAADDAPGFFLKVNKNNIPRVSVNAIDKSGKRLNGTLL